MSKHDLLTAAELEIFELDARIVSSLERHRIQRGLPPERLRVLDWGCGRGRGVLWLLERGYDAYGVDVDPLPIGKGRPLLRQRGHAEDRLRLLEGGGGSDFPSGFFDFVFSDQVLEHVRDLERVAREQRRVLAAGGGGFHQYPGRLRPVEVHLHMPLVHWLPKSGLRRLAIGLWLRSGRDPGWSWLEGRSLPERTRAYYEYSLGHTFYRSHRHVREIFERSGFEVGFEILEHPKLLASPTLTRLSRAPWLRSWIEHLLLTFQGVEMRLRARP